jgi:hypothetical protein
VPGVARRAGAAWSGAPAASAVAARAVATAVTQALSAGVTRAASRLTSAEVARLGAVNPIEFVRRVGPTATMRALAEQGWYTKLFYGLRADLTALPEVRPAKASITMTPRDPSTFRGFDDELKRVGGSDYVEVCFRILSCDAGVRTLYAADGPDGDPAYAQWLVRPAEQDVIHEHAPGRYPRLEAHEVLLEGAYTFRNSRRMGMMADGMAQLLRIARDEGFRSALTYVGADNVASLRGCATVGFVLDHVRHNERRLGRRRSVVTPADGPAAEHWEAAIAPRGG